MKGESLDDLTNDIESLLIEEASELERSGGVLVALGRDYGRNAGAEHLDEPFSKAFAQFLSGKQSPMLKRRGLSLALGFARAAGRRQFGLKSQLFIRDLIADKSSCDWSDDFETNSATRGNLIKLADALGIEIDEEILYSESALRKNARSLWLSIAQDVLSSEELYHEYQIAIRNNLIDNYYLELAAPQIIRAFGRPSYEALISLHRLRGQAASYQKIPESAQSEPIIFSGNGIDFSVPPQVNRGLGTSIH